MLFFKECKKVICSLAFILYVAVVVVMYGTQFVPALDEPMEPPKIGAEWYGNKTSDAPEVVMPGAVEKLVSEYLNGSYHAYPYMFHKEVRLKEKEEAQMAAIIKELTGLEKKTLDEFEGYEMGGYMYRTDESGKEEVYYHPPVLPEYTLSESISYEHFKELMQAADELIGGGSAYAEDSLLRYFGEVAMTYEEAVAEYEELLLGDNLPQAYLRLFSDYAGIDLAIIPVFVCVFLWQMDKRSRMEDLIYSRKRSSLSLVLTRYAALVSCMMVPLLLTLLHTCLSMDRLYPEMPLSFGKAVGTAVLWLLPSVTVVTALGALLTELLSPLIAIFAQGAWWYLALESTELVGEITKFKLMIRHNSLGNLAEFEAQYGEFIWNRWFYLVLSLALLLLTVLVYEGKRRGLWNGLVSKKKSGIKRRGRQKLLSETA